MSSRQLAELHGETASQQTLTKYGSVLRAARDNGHVEQAGTTPVAWQQPPAIVYRITDAGREALAAASAPPKTMARYEWAAEAADRYQAGESMRALCAAYRVSVPTVRDVLLAAGITPRTRVPRRRRAELDREAIVTAYKAGTPIDRIRRDHHAHWSTIRLVLADAGIEIGPRGRFDKAFLGWWAPAALQGRLQALAERRGITKTEALNEALTGYLDREEAGTASGTGETEMITYYLEVEAPSIGSLNDKLRQLGIDLGVSQAGRLGYEVHYWHDRARAQEAASQLVAGGYPARVESRNAKAACND
jgi:hypothetical protein